jgi:O-antigen biosynthesis protein
MTNNKRRTILNDAVSVIIVNYKSEKPLLFCLKEIRKGQAIRNNLEIIIVNNGTGNSKLMKEISKFPKVVLVNANKNIGFAAGVNMGIKVAKNNLILLLNPDTLASFESINLLVKCLRKNKAGIVGGANYKLNGERHNTYVRKPNVYTYLFDYTNLRKIVPRDYFHRRHYYLDQPLPVVKKEVDAVSGSFMLIDRDVIEKIGLLDEKYFMYLEDIDYCLRAGEAGFKVLFNPKSSIKHVGGYSSNNKERIHVDAWLKSRKYYVEKHENLLINLFVQLIFLLDGIIIKTLQRYK